MTPNDFLAFAEPLPEALLLIGRSGGILAANAAARERLRIEGSASGRTLSEFVSDPPAELERYLKACGRSRSLVPGALTLSLDTPMTCRTEGALVEGRKEDREAVLLLRLTPKTSAVGQFVALNQRILDLGKEVRRRRRAENEARQQGERLRVTMKSIGDAVIAADEKGRVEFMNPVAESLTGWTVAEAAGRALDEIFVVVHEKTRQRLENPGFRALRQAAVVALANHSMLICRDGTERPIDDSAAPILDPGGRVTGAVLVFRDVSARRQAEAALRDANRRKDEFLAVLAHELRNPLAPIRSGLQILRLSGNDGPAADEARRLMERQVEHMVHLVDDLMDVSRINQDMIHLRRERVEMQAVVRAAVEACETAVGEIDRTIDVSLPDKPVYIDADRVRMIQVVSNLLSNALKYTGAGGRIWLEVTREADQVLLAVRDDGIGMSRKVLPEIFDLFMRVDHTLERSQGGLGVGLAIVRRLVELHDGEIEARSAGPNQGSEFIVRLPEAPDPDAVDDPSIAEGNPVRRRVLVADNNEDRGDESQDAARDHGQRCSHRCRRGGGGRGGRGLPSGSDSAGHRHAAAERLRCLPADP